MRREPSLADPAPIEVELPIGHLHHDIRTLEHLGEAIMVGDEFQVAAGLKVFLPVGMIQFYPLTIAAGNGYLAGHSPGRIFIPSV